MLLLDYLQVLVTGIRVPGKQGFEKAGRFVVKSDRFSGGQQSAEILQFLQTQKGIIAPHQENMLTGKFLKGGEQGGHRAGMVIPVIIGKAMVTGRNAFRLAVPAGYIYMPANRLKHFVNMIPLGFVVVNEQAFVGAHAAALSATKHEADGTG